MQTSKSYFFKQALLPEGWRKNVSITIDEKGHFSHIEENSALQTHDKVLDCVIPAMPNCHSHIFQRTMAGLTEYKTSSNDSFWSWRDLMYKYANQISSQHLYHIAKYAYSEMLKAGFTSVCEFHYIHRDLVDPNNVEDMSLAIMKAAFEVGIQLTLLPVLYTQAHIDGSPLSDLQQRFKLSTSEYIALYKSLEQQLYPGQNLGICFHSLRAVSITEMTIILNALNQQQPIHIHISEQIAEVEQILEHSGLRPVELLYHHFDVNDNWCLIHATHLNANEIKLIAQSGAIVGICPITEANLGDGVFPLTAYINADGRFAIGSDSHVLINPFQELQILEYSQRLLQQQRVIASTEDVANVGSFLWNEAINSGAKACGLSVAGIQVGQLANWLSIDTENPLLMHLDGKTSLDTVIFADNHIVVEAYHQGHKFDKIEDIVTENYKNVLKSLR